MWDFFPCRQSALPPLDAMRKRTKQPAWCLMPHQTVPTWNCSASAVWQGRASTARLPTPLPACLQRCPKITSCSSNMRRFSCSKASIRRRQRPGRNCSPSAPETPLSIRGWLSPRLPAGHMTRQSGRQMPCLRMSPQTCFPCLPQEMPHMPPVHIRKRKHATVKPQTCSRKTLPSFPRLAEHVHLPGSSPRQKKPLPPRPLPQTERQVC